SRNGGLRRAKRQGLQVSLQRSLPTFDRWLNPLYCGCVPARGGYGHRDLLLRNPGCAAPGDDLTMGGETVGLIGLGNLGRPVARRLLGCGYELVVYDRDPSRTAGVVDLGAAGTTDPRELGGRVDVALTALPNRAAIEDAVLHDEHGLLAGLHPGSTLIDFSTNSLDLTRRLGDRCDEAGIHVLDAAMTQARGSVADGRAVIMVGGEPGVLERWRPLLARLSNNISAMGPHGSGTVTKL